MQVIKYLRNFSETIKFSHQPTLLTFKNILHSQYFIKNAFEKMQFPINIKLQYITISSS